ncbi:hypothetical protein ACLOJK_031413 [Asimina triloba]
MDRGVEMEEAHHPRTERSRGSRIVLEVRRRLTGPRLALALADAARDLSGRHESRMNLGRKWRYIPQSKKGRSPPGMMQQQQCPQGLDYILAPPSACYWWLIWVGDSGKRVQKRARASNSPGVGPTFEYLLEPEEDALRALLCHAECCHVHAVFLLQRNTRFRRPPPH